MRAKMEQYRTFTQWTETDCQDVGKWFTDYMQYAGYLRPTTPKMFKMMLMTAFPPLWDTTQPDLGERCPNIFNVLLQLCKIKQTEWLWNRHLGRLCF